jgi:hypothetical protein
MAAASFIGGVSGFVRQGGCVEDRRMPMPVER